MGGFLAASCHLHQSHRKSQAFEGKVKNISEGGFCVIATRAPERGGLLQGRLLFPRVLRRSLHSLKFVGHNPPRPARMTMLAYNTSSDLRLPSMCSPLCSSSSTNHLGVATFWQRGKPRKIR